MRQLFQNLISNAIKFHKPGIPPQILIKSSFISASSACHSSRSHSLDCLKQCQIECIDQGIGFDESHLHHLFTMFQRLHDRSKYEGTGMGLAICRKIVERHGGEITARSSPEQGTMFIVTLPMQQFNLPH
jgi:signal transduction histidine kinase